MGKINVLSFAVANLIAAGEVVDRPSSVIKELVENAIDAGADRITVEIQNGGISYMRVSDNGCGISKEDLPVALRRHATSKIKDAEDLEAIISLGFRGEALAAISSVSNVRIISKQKECEVGAALEAHGGVVVGVTERACSDGTSVIVEDLFYNVPARRKFLKKNVTEGMAVVTTVERVALSHPEISFRLISDGNVKLETVGDGKLHSAIYSVFGKDFASRLIPVQGSADGIGITGYIGRSDNVKSNRNYQNFFINGRYVKSKTAMAAIEQAYSSYIPPEKFPCCVVFIKIDPRCVDVNVHPSKLEVKFSNEKSVFEAIYYAVRNGLEQNTTRPQISLENGRISARDYRNMAAQPPKKPGAMSAFAPIPDRSARPEQMKMSAPTASRYPSAPTWSGQQPLDETVLRQGNVEPHPFGDGSIKTKGDTLGQKTEGVGASNASPSERFSFGTPPSEPSPRFSEDHHIRPSGNMEQVGHKGLGAVPPPTELTRSEPLTSLTGTHPTSFPAPPDAPLQYIRTERPCSIPDAEEAPVSDNKSKGGETVEVPPYRIVGEAFNSYVFIELGEKMLMVDKHAAHERIIFEQFKEIMRRGEQASQMLMLPVHIDLSREEVAALEEYRSEIESAGFTFDSEERAVNVQSFPVGIEASAIPDIFGEFATGLSTDRGGVEITRQFAFEKALYQASCKAAIKAGRQYPEEHIKWLCRRLMELPDITFCPHGRPVAIEMTKTMLDKQFERL